MEQEIILEEEELEYEVEVEEENVYFIPTGEMEITENGTFDVSQYEKVNVNVSFNKDN